VELWVSRVLFLEISDCIHQVGRLQARRLRTRELVDAQQVVAGHQRFLGDLPVREGLLTRVEVLGDGGHAQRVADDQAVVAPAGKLGQAQDAVHARRVEADGRRKLPKVALQTAVADVRGHHCVGDRTVACRFSAGHGAEGRQLDALQLGQRLVDGRNLPVGQAVAAAVPGEMLRLLVQTRHRARRNQGVAEYRSPAAGRRRSRSRRPRCARSSTAG
jgi:hypothetical protein